MDVAKKRPFNLPRRSNGLADTLGYYGVGPGPYLFLPVIGSTTVRDLLARPFDLLILPAVLPAPFRDPSVALAKGTLNALDERVNFDEDLRRLREQNDHPYAAVRDYYLTRRQAEIDYLRGKGPNVDDPDFEWKVKPAPSKQAAPPAPAAAAPVEKVPAQ
jgi:phospholipid-binding lipoprotein MlaA